MQTIENIKSEIILKLNKLYTEIEIFSFTRIIFEHFFDYKMIDIELNKNKIIENKIIIEIDKVIEGLLQKRPIQYILGYTYFYDSKFIVNENVLIPRPETEELVDLIIRENKNSSKNLKIIDIGTGSGCIPIILSKYLQNSEITSIDISEKAIEVAKKNAEQQNSKIIFLNSDFLKYENEKYFDNKIYDIIVSNPPYVRNFEKKMMNENVLEYEPHNALFVEDENPLIFYQKILKFSLHHLSQNGSIYLEINEQLGNETSNLYKKNFKNILLLNDLQGKNRILKIN